MERDLEASGDKKNLSILGGKILFRASNNLKIREASPIMEAKCQPQQLVDKLLPKK